jgi:hypothetical protein
MNIDQMTNSFFIQVNKQNRRHYTTEQNVFIVDCVKIIKIEDKREKWIEITKLFQKRFPFVQPERTPKNLLDHFEHSLNSSLKRGPFTIEEHNFISSYVNENWHQWKIIGHILNRNENQIKNEFYRKISKNIYQETIPKQIDLYDLKDEFEFESNLIDIFNF